MKINGRFGETYLVDLQGQSVSQARNQPEAGSAACFMPVISMKLKLIVLFL
jgi:hypothetical protein